MSVILVPVYILAYDFIAKMLKISGLKYKIFLGLAIIGFVIGNVWLASNAYLGIIVQSIANTSEISTQIALKSLLEQVNNLTDPLLQIIRIIVLLLSGMIIWFILKTKTNYPKWIIIFTPFTLILLIFGLYFGIPEIGQYLLPAALNISHTIFLLLSTFFAFKYVQKIKK